MQLSEQQTDNYDEQSQPPGILCPVFGQPKTNQQPLAVLKLMRKNTRQQVQVQIFHDHLYANTSEKLYYMNFDFQTYLGFEKQKEQVWFQHNETEGRQIFSTGLSEQLQNFIFQLKRRCPQRGFHKKFNLLQQAGKGKNSKSYLCERKSDGVIFAVKIQMNCSRVQNQIQILKDVEHPNLVFMREFFIESDGKVYILMDYENGGNLLTKINCPQPLNYIERLKVVIDMINALQFLRIKGIIHRDIKPQNIVFSKIDGNFKICDFGLALKTGEKIKSISGTPGYMAPELFQVPNYPFQALVEQDIYSMGLTFFQLFTGTQYYQGANEEQILQRNVKAISLKKRNYPNQDPHGIQKRLLQKMIRKDREDRKNSFEIMQSSVYKKITRIYGEQVKSLFCGKTKAKSSSSDEQNFLFTVKKLLRIQTN